MGCCYDTAGNPKGVSVISVLKWEGRGAKQERAALGCVCDGMDRRGWQRLESSLEPRSTGLPNIEPKSPHQVDLASLLAQPSSFASHAVMRSQEISGAPLMSPGPLKKHPRSCCEHSLSTFLSNRKQSILFTSLVLLTSRCTVCIL